MVVLFIHRNLSSLIDLRAQTFSSSFFYRQFTKLDGSELHIFTKTEFRRRITWVNLAGGGGEETRPQNVLKKTKTVLANWQNLHNWKLSCQYKRFKECDSRWFPKLPFDKELEQISTCWVVLEHSTGNRCSKVPPLVKFLDKYLFNNWLYLSRY